MKISYSYYDGFYRKTFSEIKDACIIDSLHAPDVLLLLQSISKRFNRHDIGEPFPRSFLKKTLTCAVTGTDLRYHFSETFSSAIDALCTPNIFSVEAKYIKGLPQYSKFLSSSLLKDLLTCIESFEKNGFSDNCGWSFHVSEVKSCELSKPNENPFIFTLWSNRYDDMPQEYEHVKFLKGKNYPALSILEISMLAIAISEVFPHLFTYTWMLYSNLQHKKGFVGQKKEYITFEFGLTPCLIR